MRSYRIWILKSLRAVEDRVKCRESGMMSSKMSLRPAKLRDKWRDIERCIKGLSYLSLNAEIWKLVIIAGLFLCKMHGLAWAFDRHIFTEKARNGAAPDKLPWSHTWDIYFGEGSFWNTAPRLCKQQSLFGSVHERYWIMQKKNTLPSAGISDTLFSEKQFDYSSLPPFDGRVTLSSIIIFERA